MHRHAHLRTLALLCAWAILLHGLALTADPIKVRYREGLLHGFLVLRTLEGKTIAHGDLIQVARGNRVTVELIFHFDDGSLYEETTVYSQRDVFRLLSDHLIQQGPSFKESMETSVDVAGGRITVSYTDEHGNKRTKIDYLRLPPDLANGLILTLLKNLPAGTPEFKVSMLVATPKPRLIKLALSTVGEEPFFVAGVKRQSVHYLAKVEIGGLAGLVAPLLNKQPPDFNFWILGGEAPAFVKLEGTLSYGGPVWRIEPAMPTWPREARAGLKNGPEESKEH